MRPRLRRLLFLVVITWVLGFVTLVLPYLLTDWAIGRATGDRAPPAGYVILEDGELKLVPESHSEALSSVARLTFFSRDQMGDRIIFPVERITRRQLLVDSIPEFKAAVTARRESWRPVMRDILISEYGWSDADAATVLLPDQVTHSPHWVGIMALIIVPLVLGTPVRLAVHMCIRSVRRSREERLINAGRCPQCGYDLRRDLEHGCSECGWNRAQEATDYASDGEIK